MRNATTTDTDSSSKTIIQKTASGDMPFPWSEKDPYKLPIAIDRVQRMLITLGWEKPWVEQIVDRIMKNMLRTTEERAQVSGGARYLSELYGHIKSVHRELWPSVTFVLCLLDCFDLFGRIPS